MKRATKRNLVVLASVLACGACATALATANNDWRQEWKSVRISPEPSTMADIPCPATPETRRMVSDSTSLEDPSYHSSERIRVLVLDDVANTGNTTVALPERKVYWEEKGNIQARQSSDFPSELNMQFRHLTGPEDKTAWEKQVQNGSGKGTMTKPLQDVRPGQGMARYLILWRVAETETRVAREGKKLRTGTRTRIRHGITSSIVGYYAHTHRVDPCTGKVISLTQN